LRARCFNSTVKCRTVLITNGYESLLRARRRWQNRGRDFIDKYIRHKWRVEGIHGEAKTQHGLRRAVRRGLANVSIQVYLTAAVMNLKRLAAFLCLFLIWLRFKHECRNDLCLIEQSFNQVLGEQTEDIFLGRQRFKKVFDLTPKNCASCNWNTGMIKLKKTGGLRCGVRDLRKNRS
jgi:hypothetical protein